MSDPQLPSMRDMQAFVANITSLRADFFRNFNSFVDPPERDLYKECKYPSSGQLNNPLYFRELFDRDPIANRVTQLMPKESFAVSPCVFESEDPDEVTQFEEAWDAVGQSLRGEQCWYGEEEGSPVWEYLERLDVLSGIGYFGVMLLGIDDGRNLDQPADGVMQLNPVTNQLYPSKVRHADAPPRDADGNVFAFSEPQASPLMVPVVNAASGTADFLPVERARRAFHTNQLVVNKGKAQPWGGWGANQPRHSPDASQASTSNPFHGAVGTDAQYVGVELSPPEYPASEPAKGPRRLLYARCFDESLVQIVQYEADMRNPRFGQPVMYRITLNDPSSQHSGVGLPLATVRVHWSRVIHAADNLSSSEIFGVPRQRPVLHPILDARKTRASGAEGNWRGAFPGISFETHPQLGGDVNVNIPQLKQTAQDYWNGMDRALYTSGMTARTMSPVVSDPTPISNLSIEAICIQLACPVRVFKGSERGEMASSQDDSSWNDRVKGRQKRYVTPRLIVPFVDRLIALGVLPQPGKKKRPTTNRGWRVRTVVKALVRNAEGEIEERDPKAPVGDGEQKVGTKEKKSSVIDTPTGYSIEWPDIDSETKAQKAAISVQVVTALQTYIAGNVESIMPPAHFYTKVMGWSEEEASQIIDDAKKHQEDPMTMPPAGEDGHPASPPPPPPPPPVPDAPAPEREDTSAQKAEPPQVSNRKDRRRVQPSEGPLGGGWGLFETVPYDDEGEPDEDDQLQRALGGTA